MIGNSNFRKTQPVITYPTQDGLLSSTYGGLFDYTQQILNLPQMEVTQINLGISMPMSNVSHTEKNTLTIEQTGVYEINYNTDLSASVTTTLTVFVLINGAKYVDGAVSALPIIGGGWLPISGSIIANLAAGDKVTLNISTYNACTVTFSINSGASMTVKKL